MCGPSEGLGCRKLLPGKVGYGLEMVGPEGVIPSAELNCHGWQAVPRR